MKIQINITGTKVALNTWTNATAKVGKKTYTIQMVVFEEGSEYGIEEGIPSAFRAGSGKIRRPL